MLSKSLMRRISIREYARREARTARDELVSAIEKELKTLEKRNGA